jgi:hypothetical protein
MRCAIHQPNFFPRLSTLAKLYAADCWIVLDDVQFARRDYQHRCRLAPLGESARWQWLSLSVRLPAGRVTRINQARLVDRVHCQRRIEGMTRHLYTRSPYWPTVSESLQRVLDLMDRTDSLTEVTTSSTRVLLDALGWRGKVVKSSDLIARTGRSERLADLTRAVGASEYICGTGGMRYIQHEPFTEQGLMIIPFGVPASSAYLWQDATRLSALWGLMSVGVEGVLGELRQVTSVS